MTPAEVVLHFADCMRTSRYEEAARCFTARCLERIRSDAESRFEAPWEPTVEEILAENPKMSPEDARDAVAAYVEFASRHPPRTPDLAGIRSLAELERLSLHGVVARWLEASDQAAQHRAAIDQLIERYPGFREQLHDQRDDGAAAWRIEAVGTVQKEERAYVLWQNAHAPGDGEHEGPEMRPGVVVLEQGGRGWEMATDLRPNPGPARMTLVVSVESEDGETRYLSTAEEDLANGM